MEMTKKKRQATGVKGEVPFMPRVSTTPMLSDEVSITVSIRSLDWYAGRSKSWPSHLGVDRTVRAYEVFYFGFAFHLAPA